MWTDEWIPQNSEVRQHFLFWKGHPPGNFWRLFKKPSRRRFWTTIVFKQYQEVTVFQSPHAPKLTWHFGQVMFLRVFQHILLEHIATYQNSTPKQATVYEGIPPSFGFIWGIAWAYAPGVCWGSQGLCLVSTSPLGGAAGLCCSETHPVKQGG